MICIPSTSVEFLHTAVSGDYTNAMPVYMAVMPYGQEPTSSDWKAAAWDSGNAKVLIGTGSPVGAIAEGLYGVWVKVVTGTETPVLYSGAVRIT